MTKSKIIKPGRIIYYLILLIIGILVLYPLLFMFMTSLKANTEVFNNPFGITKIHFENYLDAWRTGRVGSYFLNSVKVSFLTLMYQIIIISLASYSIGKLKPWGSGIIFSAILMMMFVSTEMVTVPNYVTIRSMGILGTHAGLIIWYTASGLVMGTYILTNFIRSLPKELDEAAIIDGAGIFQIMISIDMPLVMPALATLVIFNFNGVWSEFYWALITINRYDKLKTLPLGLINFQSQYTSNYAILTAGLCILTLPVIIVYLFFSKYFIANITQGAIKG